MSTHGFIEVNYENKPKEDRTLIHAVHDGYLSDMVGDILTLPFYIFYDLKKDKIINYDIPEFLKNDNRNKRKYIYECFEKEKNKSYEELVHLWGVMIPLDDTRFTFPSYLIAKRPDKYQICKEPFVLYSHPVEEADIKIDFIDSRLNTAKINIKCDDDERGEYLDLIIDINKYISEKNAKIKILKDNTIIMNIDKMVVDLFYNLRNT